MAEVVEAKLTRKRTVWTDERINDLLGYIERGGLLRVYCREHGIEASGFYHVKAQDDVLAKRFAQARAIGCEELLEETVEIADEQVCDSDAVQRNKLRIHTRQQFLARIDPSRYGDKVQIGGARDLPPIGLQLSVAETEERVRELIDKGRQRALANDDDDELEAMLE